MKRSALACVFVLAAAACGGSSPAAQRPVAGAAPASASTDVPAGATGDDADAPREAPPGVVCPDQALTSARAAGGTCFDPSIVGEDVVAACIAQLAAEGWVHDPIAEQKLGEQTHLNLVCWHLLTTASLDDRDQRSLR